MKPTYRYHPALVTLHWLIAALIGAALIVGFFVLAPMPNSDPHKLRVLAVHMAGGILILVLMVMRFLVRARTTRPPAATTGSPRLDAIAPIVHYGFYMLVIAMAGTGYATAILAGLKRIVFQRSGEPLPSTFTIYPTFLAHSYLAILLVGFIALHLIAALYHQFVRRDRLFARMWFS